ncbi:MAG: aldose 1-epimerase [Burkholderiaceae bacterium]
MSDTPCELRAGALRLALRPDLGGSIAGLWFDNLPVLRSTEPEALATSRASGCYPLVPYSNRLGYRRFAWKGRSYEVAANIADEPHALHGVGWQRPWRVKDAATDRAVLELTHPSDAHWPFAFHVEQVFELTAQALQVTMNATNIDSRSAPMGLGWHPYFPKRARSRIHLEVAARWESDAAKLPVRSVAQPGIDADIAVLDFDHCFDGWRGEARVRDERLSLRLASSLDRAVVYTPRDKPYFCVEPVSHVSNAIHMAEPARHGLASLAPEQSLSAWLRLAVARA